MTTEAVPEARFRVWYGTGGDTAKNKMLHDMAAPRLAKAIGILAALPDADAVAEFFASQGVTGRIGVSNDCPAAIWFTGQVGYVCRVSNTVSIAWDGATTSFDCPAHLVTFYQRFDRGLYSELRRPDKYGRIPEYANA